jgi:hypothetical protein
MILHGLINLCSPGQVKGQNHLSAYHSESHSPSDGVKALGTRSPPALGLTPGSEPDSEEPEGLRLEQPGPDSEQPEGYHNADIVKQKDDVLTA